MAKVIENVELVEIRAADGAQLYRFGPGDNDIEWLTGICRAKNVSVGDTGRLVFKSSGSSGLYWFEKTGPVVAMTEQQARKKFAAYFLDLKESMDKEGGKVSMSAEWDRCIEHWIAEGDAPSDATKWKYPRSPAAEMKK